MKDDPSYNDFGHSETSDGKALTGSYYVVLPDGRKQIVNYKVDAYSGYVADVQYEGIAKQPAYAPAAAYKPVYSAPVPAYEAPVAPYYRPAVKAYATPAPVYKVTYKPTPTPAPPAPEEKEVAVEKVEPVAVVQEEPSAAAAVDVDVAKVEPAAVKQVKEETVTANKVEWTEPIKVEETPIMETVSGTDAAPAEADAITTEAATSAVPAVTDEAVTEKVKWAEPAATTDSNKTKDNKRSYQRSWTSLSQPHYYAAGRIRKRHPVTTNARH